LSADLERYRHDLTEDAELVARVLQSLPAAPGEGDERMIRTLPENVDAALGRALARAAILGEVWEIEIVEE